MKNSGFEKDWEEEKFSINLIPLDIGPTTTCRVYKAKVLGKWLFVKELKPEYIDNARLESAFRKEMELGFQLDHPGLPRYQLTKGILPEGKFVAMEFIDGLTLDNFVKENPDYFSNSANVKRFILELADVLDYLHSRQILHLDIKPSNVMLTRVGSKLKLIDLGFCSSDVFIDTAGYTSEFKAPERNDSGEKKTEAVDFYGMGRLLQFIRENTPQFAAIKYRKLENALLNPDRELRPSNKFAVEKLLPSERKVSGSPLMWISVSFLFMTAIIVAVILWWPNNRQKEHTMSEESFPVEDSVVSEPNPAEVVEIENTPDNVDDASVETSLAKEVQQIQKNDNEPSGDASVFNSNQAAMMRDEVERRIRKIYLPVDVMLKSALRNEEYSGSNYEAIVNMIDAASHEAIQTKFLKKKYPGLSEDLIEMTVADQMEKIERETWRSAWDKYQNEYSRRNSSGDNKK